MWKNRFTMSGEKGSRPVGRVLLLFLIISFAAEIFIFNLRSVQSLFYQKVRYPLEDLEVENAEAVGNGVFLLHSEDADGRRTGQFYLTGLREILGEKELRNVFLEIGSPQAEERPDRESGVAGIRLYVRDEGHDRYAELAEHVLDFGVQDSAYLWLDPYGRVKTLVLDTSLSEGEAVEIRAVWLNAAKPFSFSAARMLAVFLCLALLYGLRGESTLWSLGKYGTVRHEALYAVALGLFLLLPPLMLNLRNGYVTADMHFRPYQDLAEALAWGQLHLRTEPPEALGALDNPYDYTAREAAGLAPDADYMWDTAYFQGKYYVYFGVVPCILFYLPYLLATGLHLQDVYVILILGVALYAGIYMLCRRVLGRFSSRPPYAFQLLATATVFLGSCITGCMASPDAHDVPRICGLVFVIWGLYFWMSAAENGMLTRKCFLWLGSLFMALAVGCRPNQLLFSFMAVPVLLPLFRNCRLMEKKNRAGVAVSLLLPYIPVAVLLMLYNLFRFGSIFDFGYDYNLTVLDYTQKNLFLDRIVIGISEYLLRIPRMSYQFPFLQKGTFAQGNGFGHGSFYYTWCYGGLLVCNLILWCVPAGLRRSAGGNTLREKLLGGWDLFAVSLLGVCAAELFINIGVAGVAWHYLTDFAAPLLLAGWIGAAALWQKLEYTPGKDYLRRFLVLGAFWSLFYHSCFYLISNLQAGNTELYYRLYYTFHFF